MQNLTVEPENALPEPEKENEKTPSRRSAFLVTLLFLTLVGTGYWFFSRTNPERAGKAANPKVGNVPVEVAEAQTGNLPVYLNALGTVTPLNTVSVVSRIQGQIMNVNYREGQTVKKGESLIEIDPRPYQAAVLQAEGQLKRDEALLRQARIDLKRYRLAYRTRSIPKQLLDDQEQIVLQYEGAVTADQGVLQSAQVNLLYCHITSPMDGRVGLRLIDSGNLVQANSTTALAVVTQLQPITVIFNLPEDSLPAIQEQLAQAGSMRVDALDRTQQRVLASGAFLAMDNLVDVTTGTVRLRAVFENQENSLFPNQFVNARLQLKVLRDAVLIPSQAIQTGPQGTFVYVIRPDQTAQVRVIKPSVTEGNLTAIAEGLKPGEQIAIQGFDKLREGAKVSIHRPTQSESSSDASMAGQAQEKPSQEKP